MLRDTLLWHVARFFKGPKQRKGLAPLHPLPDIVCFTSSTEARMARGACARPIFSSLPHCIHVLPLCTNLRTATTHQTLLFSPLSFGQSKTALQRTLFFHLPTVPSPVQADRRLRKSTVNKRTQPKNTRKHPTITAFQQLKQQKRPFINVATIHEKALPPRHYVLLLINQDIITLDGINVDGEAFKSLFQICMFGNTSE